MRAFQYTMVSIFSILITSCDVETVQESIELNVTWESGVARPTGKLSAYLKVFEKNEDGESLPFEQSSILCDFQKKSDACQDIALPSPLPNGKYFATFQLRKSDLDETLFFGRSAEFSIPNKNRSKDFVVKLGTLKDSLSIDLFSETEEPLVPIGEGPDVKSHYPVRPDSRVDVLLRLEEKWSFQNFAKNDELTVYIARDASFEDATVIHGAEWTESEQDNAQGSTKFEFDYEDWPLDAENAETEKSIDIFVKVVDNKNGIVFIESVNVKLDDTHPVLIDSSDVFLEPINQNFEGSFIFDEFVRVDSVEITCSVQMDDQSSSSTCHCSLPEEVKTQSYLTKIEYICEVDFNEAINTFLKVKYNLKVTALDPAGNPSQNQERLVADNKPPSITSDLPEIIHLNTENRIFNLQLEASEPLSELSIRIATENKEEMVDCQERGTHSLLYECKRFFDFVDGDGSAEVSVEMVDLVGNENTASYMVPVEYSFSKPKLSSPLSERLVVNNQDNNLSFLFDVSEPLQDISVLLNEQDITDQCDRDGTNITHYECNYPVAPTSDTDTDTMDIVFQLVDTDGNRSDETYLGFVLVDFSDPLTTSSLPETIDVNSDNSSLIFEFSVSESLREFIVYLGDEDMSHHCRATVEDSLTYTCERPTSTADSDGAKQLSIVLIDEAGNQTTLVAENAPIVVYDFSRPVLLSKSVTPGPVKAGAVVSLAGVFTEPIRHMTVNGDGLNFTKTDQGEEARNQFRYEYTVQDADENRQYDFTMTVTDDAGNVATNLILGSIVIDTAPPAVVSSEAETIVVDAEQEFEFEFEVSEPLYALTPIVNEHHDLVTCYRKGGSEVQYFCVGEASIEHGEGTKNVVVVMTDYAGNQNREQLNITVEYEFETPGIISSRVEPKVTNGDDDILVAIWFSEAVSHVRLTADGLVSDEELISDELNTNHVFRFEVSPDTADGTYAIELISAVDSSGNLFDPPFLDTVTVDTQNPSVNECHTNQLGFKDGDIVELSCTFSEALEDLFVIIGDTPLPESAYLGCDDDLTCSVTYQVSAANDDDGFQNLYIGMIDTAGNSAFAVYEDELYYDFSAPQLLQSYPREHDILVGESISISIEFSEVVQWNSLRFNEEHYGQVTISPQEDSATYEVDFAANHEGMLTFSITAVSDLVGNEIDTTSISIASITISSVSDAGVDGGEDTDTGLHTDTSSNSHTSSDSL